MRPSFVCCAATFPPRGRLYHRLLENKLRPSFVAVRRHQATEIAFGRQLGEKSPPGGRLYHRLLENKLRPLIFRNFFRNIQKIKNGLRIICYAPHQSVSRTASPRGEAYFKGIYLKFQTPCNSPLRNRLCLPGGKPISKAIISISNALQQSVTRRAMPAHAAPSLITPT